MSHIIEHLRVFLGDEYYERLLKAGRGSKLFGQPLTGLSAEELVVAIQLQHDQHEAALRRVRQIGRYEGTATESGLLAQ